MRLDSTLKKRLQNFDFGNNHSNFEIDISAEVRTNRYLVKTLGMLALIGCQQILPCASQTNIVDRGYSPVVCANRAIKAGSYLTFVSDLNVLKQPYTGTAGSSEMSPGEILGHKAKINLELGQIIRRTDIDSLAKITSRSTDKGKELGTEFGSISYAAKNISAGSVIGSISDIKCVQKRRENFALDSVFSPREILGFKVKTDLRKNQVVDYADIDFRSHIKDQRDLQQIFLLGDQLRIARLQWPSPSDAHWELVGVGQSNPSPAARGPLILATRNIAKGTQILDAQDLQIVIVPQSEIPSDALVSPFSAIGGKAKYNISKNHYISMHDLEFSSKPTAAERQLIGKKLSQASQKWKGLSVEEFLDMNQRKKP